MLAIAVPVAAMPVQDAKADFNPGGRPRPGRPRPGTPRPGTPRPGAAQPDQPEGPGSDALIKRYMGIVLSRPSAAFPLRRLTELYRERDGDITRLIADLEQRSAAGGADQWAAKVALAGVYRIEKRIDDSIRLLREAQQDRPSDADVSRALAEAVLERGDLAEARSLFESALAKTSAQPDKEEMLRALVRIALDQKDYAGARGYHQKLVALAQGSLFVRAELGRELLARSEYEQAEAEFRDLVKAATGDNRTLAPALRDLGSVLIRERKNQEAIEVLRRALTVAGQAAGVRTEIHKLITEAYRAEGKLPELIGLLAKDGNPDFEELVTLGLLYEETGQVDKALDAYRRALRSNQRHIDTRLKVIHILQAQGELDEAVREYEALVRAVPGNPEFVFELCEILIQRGDRAKALQLLTQAEARTRDDEQLARLADFYERIEENDRALRIMQRLGSGGSRDPQYVIDLGDRYFQQGDKKKAVETWARLKTILPNRAEALAALGEVYLDHDMATEALEALREAAALAPKNLRLLKSLALALERTAAASSSGRTSVGTRFVEALKSWQQLLDAAVAAHDTAQAREARMHIVTLWSLSKQLPAQVPPLSRAFSANPPNVDAGWMLSEVLVRLRRLAEAEAALVRLTQLRPGDAEAFLSLERVYVMQHKLQEAIATLDKLVRLDPKRARQYYQRMAQYAAELYRDDDAVQYAAQAVALAPDDAEGHRKLGEMYRRRQDNDKAIGEFRAAIAKNDRLFLVYFDLAELLLARGQADEADQLYRRVVRTCPDEEMVARAARLSMQINLGRGTLETLERELLPVALGHPQKHVYRRLLVDLYGAMTFPLVQRVRYGTDKEAEAARTDLARIGTRAVKPLLDALTDDNQAQQLIAIEVLAFVQNRSAAPALFAFATGQADLALRTRAMIACGALDDPAMLPRFKALLSPDAEAPTMLGGPILLGAAWSVARMTDPKALPFIRQLARQGAPEIRALAILGLGVARDRASIGLLDEVIRSPEAGNVARAAAAYALAELNATAQAPTLSSMARGKDAIPRQAALVALARLDRNRAKDAIAEALIDTNPDVRKAALAGAVVLAGHAARKVHPFDVPEASIDVRTILQGLVPSDSSPAARVQALELLEEPLTAAARQAVRTSPDRAQILADALLARPDRITFAPFTDGTDELPEAQRAKADQIAAHIAAAVAPDFVMLVRHPSVDLRTRALRVLARQPTADARKAIVGALHDDDESVQRTALSLLGDIGSDDASMAVSEILANSPSWAFRVQAARALGSLQSGRVPRAAIDALARAARQDPYALVRQAAIEALAKAAPAEARRVLAGVAASDPEPRVKQLAQKLLSGG